MKNELINSIHHLIYNNVYCSDPKSPKWGPIAANGYEKRMIGFKAEIELSTLLKKQGIRTLDGGWMLSNRSKKRCVDNSMYFTISNDEPSGYIRLYSHLNNMGFERMFFIHYEYDENIQEWNISDPLRIGVDIPYPDYTCYEFKDGGFVDVTDGEYNISPLSSLYTNKKYTRYKAAYNLNADAPSFAENVLGSYPVSSLVDILANRFVFDGVLGFNVIRGIPSDIDLIIEKDNIFILLEVKEKDLSKRPPVGFGMDTPRMGDIMGISDTLGVPYYYIVKQVNNQYERNFVDWWSVEIHDFFRATESSREIQGGTGMATAFTNQHPTLVAPIEKYTRITDNFEGFFREQ